MDDNNQMRGLWDVFRDQLAGATYTDLTHAFFPGQPRFPSFPDEQRSLLNDYSLGDVGQVHLYSHVGQWGTHVDPPIHYVKGGRTLDQIPVSEMLLPLVVLDMSTRVASDPDATACLADIESWEQRFGRIPERSFVALRTDWSHRWPDSAQMHNRGSDGLAHCPGWSLEVLTCLIEQRGITAIGHEQLDTDPGVAVSVGDDSLERYVLSCDRWQIELLTNLDKLPAQGALVMATWPKPKGGSGFPARIVAIHR
jgi:kynurenine formamidase